jgi:type 1 glutamine amidotransferase
MSLRLSPLLAAGAAAILLGVIAAGNVQAAGSAHAATPARADKKKLLVVTHTTGFRHDSIPTAEKVLADIGEKSGVYTVEYCRTGDDVKKMLTPDWLNANHIDAVFFANTTGNLGIPDLNAFVDWVKAGHGFLGAHSAGDTYHPQDAGGNTAYIDMVGCEFKTHGRQAEAKCQVEDTRHPATAHLGSEYDVFDEIYHFKVNNRPTVHVLLSCKVQPNDGVKNDAGEDGSGKPTDMLIAWSKNFGKGKVFYTALGHRKEVWESEPYQQHILGAIRWATGLARGSGRPQAAGRAAK